MDCAKVGRLIAQLRKEKGLTQQNISDALGVSNKAVSKWECGLGCPDSSLWPDLSVILGVETAQLMEGEIVRNRPDNGNIDRVRFYVCPLCGNVLTSTGSASIFCCGRKLERLKGENEFPAPHMDKEIVETDYYLTFDHPMNKDHYLLFAAYVKSDRLFLTRLYPEQSPALRIPYIPGGKLYLYCTQHGLSVYKF
jgi:DNA-binding XRE family transcriptional regulator